MNKSPQLSIIYAYYNTPLELAESIQSIKQAVGRTPYEVIIVDNQSIDKVPETIKKLQFVTVIENKKNIGYGAALNVGVKRSKSPYALCVNTDVIFRKDSLIRLLTKIKSNSDIGAVGPQILSLEGEPHFSASKYPFFPINLVLYTFLRHIPFFKKTVNTYHYPVTRNNDQVEAISGACMLFRKKAFESVLGFDKQFFLYFEESDICKRLRDKRYTISYLKDAKVTHHVGKSLTDDNKIQTYFERSRLLFIKKYQGASLAFLSETLIRSFTLSKVVLLILVSISLYLNLLHISTQMMFIGDFARDMLVARNMVLTGNIPLVGIPSSVVWLHQGPLSIYFIGLSFLIGGFNPWIPSIFFGVLGSFSTVFVYLLGKKLVNSKVGFFAACVYVTSPLVIINHRIPYHTAPISFFSALFLLVLYQYLVSRRFTYLILTGFILGLLFQLELSNAVLFFVTAVLFVIERATFTKQKAAFFFGSVAAGILPFILYDIFHTFVQTGGFFAWVLNRIRLFFGLSISGNSTTSSLPSALETITDNLVRFIFPSSSFVALILIGGALFIIFMNMFINKRSYTKNLKYLFLSLFIPLLGFAIHTRPGSAYFPVIFPQLAILFGYLFYTLSTRVRMTFVLFFLLCTINAVFTVSHSYFLDIREQQGAKINDWNYGLGPSLLEQQNMINFVKEDADGQAVTLLPGGFLRDFVTSMDNYKYLMIVNGVNHRPRGKVYTVYQDRNEIFDTEEIIYESENIFVVHE